MRLVPSPISIGTRSAGRVLVAGQPQPLHLADVVAVALAFERVVVEVRRRRSHRAEGERVALGVTTAGGVDVVGELDPTADTVRSRSSKSRPAAAAPSRIGSKNTSAVSGKNELPIHPSASSPVSRRFAGPSEAT